MFALVVMHNMVLLIVAGAHDDVMFMFNGSGYEHVYGYGHGCAYDYDHECCYVDRNNISQCWS